MRLLALAVILQAIEDSRRRYGNPAGAQAFLEGPDVEPWLWLAGLRREWVLARRLPPGWTRIDVDEDLGDGTSLHRFLEALEGPAGGMSGGPPCG